MRSMRYAANRKQSAISQWRTLSKRYWSHYRENLPSAGDNGSIRPMSSLLFGGVSGMVRMILVILVDTAHSEGAYREIQIWAMGEKQTPLSLLGLLRPEG